MVGFLLIYNDMLNTRGYDEGIDVLKAYAEINPNVESKIWEQLITDFQENFK